MPDRLCVPPQSFGHDHMLSFFRLKQLGMFIETDVSLLFIQQPV